MATTHQVRFALWHLHSGPSYIYDVPIGDKIPSLEDYKYGVEHLFIALLTNSKFRTLVYEKCISV